MWFRGLSQAHAGAEAVDDKEADKMTSLSPPPDSSMSALSTLCRLWLGDVWERMGLEEEAVEDRERTASKVVSNTLKEMREEEEKTLAQIVDRVEKHGMERTRLAKELGEPLDEPDSALGLVQLERLLRHEVAGLRAKKEERMAEVLELKRRDKSVCRRLEMEPFAISSSFIPTKEQFEGLKKHLDDMNSLKAKRIGKFSEAKLSILQLLEQLECEPDNSFERTIVCEDEESFVLSAANLDAVEAYLERLNAKLEVNRKRAREMRERMLSLITKLDLGEEEKMKLHQELEGHTPTILKELKRRLDELEVLKVEKIGQIIEATRRELRDLWDACYYGQEQREKFASYYSDSHTEELLEEHEKEIARLKSYYETHEELFRKVTKRQELWNKMLELDEKRKDPTHLFKAKGPALLIEEKERKRVTKFLPKVDQELAEAMAEFYEKNGVPFLVGGQPYDDFILQQEADYQQQRDFEAQMKQKAKKELIEQETIYGIRPTTPAKLRANMTSAKVTSSSLKRKAPGSVTPGGPGGVGGGAKRLHLAPVGSTSTMTRARAAGNVTGSAKNETRYALRGQASSRRRILGDSNASVMHSGMHHGGAAAASRAGRQKALVEETLGSVTSENFVRGAPVNSTFGPTPESTKRRRSPRFAAAAAAVAAAASAHSTPVKRSRHNSNQQQQQQQQRQRLARTLINTSSARKGRQKAPGSSFSSPRTPPVFKTPRNRIQTPGAATTSKKSRPLTLRSGRKMPFLI